MDLLQNGSSNEDSGNYDGDFDRRIQWIGLCPVIGGLLELGSTRSFRRIGLDSELDLDGSLPFEGLPSGSGIML